MSRIGRKPLSIPKDAKVEIKENFISIEGPKGKLARTFSSRIGMEVKDNQIFITRTGNTKLDKGQQGLVRALVGNMLKGVTEGYAKELEINGVGFKAVIQGNTLTMNLGYSHPVIFNIPEEIKIEVPKPTQVIIRGINKEKVGELAAEIRSAYPPEPYKGKGVRYAGEYVKIKVGKAQAAGGK